MKIRRFAPVGLVVLACSSVAHAADLGVVGTRLFIKQTATGTRIRFSTPTDPGVQKGPAGTTSQLNGTFELSSEPGRGTTVRVTTPFRRAV